jgi:hypothetical protein
MSQDQMLERATHAFVGVIEKQAFERWPFFSVPGFPGFDPKYRRYWRVLRREVRVEIVVKGVEARKRINIYEITWTGGATGDWNSTQDNERDLFLVRVENGRYHVVRDWWRSIFPIYSGSHARLPLDETRPFWERVGLLTWWVRPDHGSDVRWFDRNDPGSALGSWRRTKLLRGLLRHPDPSLRLRACKEMLVMGLGQDECWDNLNEEDRKQLIANAPGWLTSDSISKDHRGFIQHAKELWGALSNNQDQLRLFTAANDQRVRREFCGLYKLRFPGDMDTGCPSDRPIPATIVTEEGDIPLLGNWPQQ